MRRRLIAMAATGGGLALTLTGCLGSGEVSTGTMELTAAQALTKTSQKTGQSASFRADITVAGTGSRAFTVRADGQFRLRPALAFSGRLNEFSQNGQQIPGIAGQAVFTGNVLYAKSPRIAQMAGGKPWVKLDLDRAQQRTGIDFARIVKQVERVNPAELTKMFTASDDARKVGTEKIDGVETVHYTGSVTVREALERVDPARRDDLRRALPKDANERINFDVWLDKDQLPRKLVVKGQGDQGEHVTLTILGSDYGKSVTVQAPPADQVGDISGLLGAFGGHRN